MASLRTTRQGNRLQNGTFMETVKWPPLALPSHAISARESSERKHEDGRKGNDGLAETFLALLLNRSFSLEPSYFSLSPLFLPLAGKPIAQLVTRTNSLFRLSLFPTFRIGRQWSQREMAGRVLRLGRKAEVDKRQSGIGQRRVEARNEKWKGTGVIRERRKRPKGKRKKRRGKEKRNE